MLILSNISKAFRELCMLLRSMIGWYFFAIKTAIYILKAKNWAKKVKLE